MTEPKVDLSKLALDRSPSENAAIPRRRRWFSRYVFPLSIITCFIVLLGTATGRHLFPVQAVEVVPVISKRGEIQQAGKTLFQAAGWVEPRPTAIQVAALSSGIIEELLVVEGQKVLKGEAIARLITLDAEIAVEQSKSTLEIREGELQRAKAEQNAASIRLQKPVHLQVPLADAKSLLAKAKTEYDKLPFLIKTATANVSFTRSSLKNKQSAQSAIAGIVIEQAVNQNAAAVSQLEELRKRQINLKREVEAFQRKVDTLQRQYDLLVDENRQLQESNAKVVSAIAIRNQAKLSLRKSKLNLERTVIRAPITGKILRLTSFPGSRVTGLDGNADHRSNTVVEMFDPTRLQVRADVRLEDVPMITPGAPVNIETSSTPKVIKGRVLLSTGSANIQKNTLEVKVEILDPPATISPEMLVTATFLAPKLKNTLIEPEATERLFIPTQLIHKDENSTFVWTVNADNQAFKKTITTGGTNNDELTEVLVGLNITDKIISSAVNKLRHGDTITIRGENQTIGIRN